MIKFAWNYIRNYKGYMTIVILSLIITNVISLFIPRLEGNIIDILTNFRNGEKLIVVLGIWLCCALFGFFIQYLKVLIELKLQTQASFECNQEIITHIHRIPILELKNDPAYLNQRINNASNEIISYTIENPINILINIAIFCYVMFVMVRINVATVIIIGVFILVDFLLYKKFSDKLYQNSRIAQEKQSIFFSELHNEFENREFIKIQVLDKFFKMRAVKKFEILVETLVGQQKNEQNYLIIKNIIELILQVSFFMIGGFAVLNNRISVGALVVIVQYIGIMLASLDYFYSLGNATQDSRACYQYILNILDIKNEENGIKRIKNIQNIKIKNLTFSYNDSNKLFKNLSCTFLKGKIYGIVGKNGSGKTTLLKLLAGIFLNKYQGAILINGTDINEIDRCAYRQEKIAYVQQQKVIISGTIKENLALLNNNDNYAETEFTKKFLKDMKLSSEISPELVGISEGQNQKINILRALNKESEVILMDEPTSSLDLITKKLLMEYLNSKKSNKIIIVVTHDDSIYPFFDEIIKMDKQSS